jgi:NAD(P)-dependent dehydrogenase (short-subunit alcohol dehydrogenase family)
MATIVVTGASAGIGAAAVIELTRQGHTVLAIGRSVTKLAAVHAAMIAAAPAGVEVPEPLSADFASLDEVRKLAEVILGGMSRLDVLANNAGLNPRHRQPSAHGYELTFAVNHLAPFFLTKLLEQRIRESNGRVVGTSSGMHRIGRIDFDGLAVANRWGGLRAYARSKLANILFTREFVCRTGLPASCYDPGGTNTELGRDSDSGLRRSLFGRFSSRTPEQGAETLIWLAISAEGAAPRAVYYADHSPARVSAAARDDETARRLWEVSGKMVGLRTSG